MHNLDFHGDFLVHTRPASTESVRSLLNRFAAGNKLPLGGFGEDGLLTQATQMACKLGPRVDWDLEKILRRGALFATREYGQDTVAIGMSLLGRRCMVGHRRRICPLCVAQRPWCPLAWELRINVACHHHGCLLIDKCTRCNAHLSWMTYGADCTACGLRWASMEIGAAPPWAVRLSTWLWASTNRSIRSVHQDGKQHGRMLHIRLEKLLLMIEVLRHEMLRNWLSPRTWEQWNLPWTVELLDDFQYRSWLWSNMFLHAAKNPMTLSKALIPFGTALSISSYFKGFAPNAPVPYFVIKSLRHLGEKRLLKRLSVLRHFDARVDGIYGFAGFAQRFDPLSEVQEVTQLSANDGVRGKESADEAELPAASPC